MGTDAGALRPVDVNDRYGAPVWKTPSGTRPGLCLDVSDGGATEDRATAVSAKEATHAVEDDATRADELNASGSSSVPSLAPFEELPRWAAAGVQQHERERAERETEKLANLAKVAAGSKWAANAPGGYAPKLEGLSASVIDHGDVDVRIDEDEDRPDKENEPTRSPRRAPSVVSLKPLDDDDDALYYAESEPGGALAEHSAAPGAAFGVVTTSPRREGSDVVATDETVVHDGIEATTPAHDAKAEELSEDRPKDKDRPKGVFARVAAMLGRGEETSEPPRQEGATRRGTRKTAADAVLGAAEVGVPDPRREQVRGTARRGLGRRRRGGDGFGGIRIVGGRIVGG